MNKECDGKVVIEGDMNDIIEAIDSCMDEFMQKFEFDVDESMDIREEKIPDYTWKEVYYTMGVEL